MGEADPDEEGHHARDGFEFADFDVVIGRAGTGRDQQLLHALVRDRTHNPDAVIARAFLVRSLLAQDLGAIAALHEIAESGFSDHIRCFDFPVHTCGHTSLRLRRMIALSTMDRTTIRKYIFVHQEILSFRLLNRQTFAKPDELARCCANVGDLRKKLKRLQPIPQAIVLTILLSGGARAETCFPPVRPFVPNDENAVAEFVDLIGQDFEAYIEDVQVYFRCLDSERARAFEEARQVSQDYERFLKHKGDPDP